MRSAMIAALSVAIAVGVKAQTTETTIMGFVTDTYCGRGANDKHAEHARRSVASGVAQYALYVEGASPEASGLYILAPQSTAAQYVGQRVQTTGTLSSTPITRAGQSLAPDAAAAYKDSSAPNGLRATGATSGTSTAPGTPEASGQTATPTAARGSTARVQVHEDAPDQSTAVAGVLSISSVAAAPPPKRPGQQQ